MVQPLMSPLRPNSHHFSQDFGHSGGVTNDTYSHVTKLLWVTDITLQYTIQDSACDPCFGSRKGYVSKYKIMTKLQQPATEHKPETNQY